MAAPQVSALPEAPSRADSPSTFTQRADALLGSLRRMVDEFNALNEYANEQAAYVGQRVDEANSNGLKDAAGNAAKAATYAAQSQSAKAQAETARDQALAGLGAADQSLNLIQLMAGLEGALSLAGMALREQERNIAYRVQSGEVTVTQAASAEHTRTYATAAVTLPRPYLDTAYQVEVECIAAAPFLGCEGKVQVQSRAVNGFVLAITGSATSATLRWKVLHPNAK